MKETKKFFDTNRLNKGYSKSLLHKQTEGDNTYNQLKHLLPPMNIMAEYEEMNPGTIQKVLNLAEKEQQHRHSMDLLAMAEEEKANKLGRQFAIILVTIIATATAFMAYNEHYMIAALFIVAGFGTIATASIFHSNKIANNKSFHKNFVPKYKASGYKIKNKR